MELIQSLKKGISSLPNNGISSKSNNGIKSISD